MTFLLALVCILVGFLCGATSIGGILLIPAIQYLAVVSLPVAGGTALCSFFFTALWGMFLHFRLGNLRKELCIPQCLGAAIFGILGALAKYFVGAVALNFILSILIIISGIATLRPPHKMSAMESERGKFRFLFCVGGAVGFLAGLTGIGGPILSVPAMIIMGFPPLLTVAAAQSFQAVACLSGTFGNIIIGQINWSIAISSVFLQAIGVWLGVRVAKGMDTSRLKLAIAALCIMTGIFMLIK